MPRPTPPATAPAGAAAAEPAAPIGGEAARFLRLRDAARASAERFGTPHYLLDV